MALTRDFKATVLKRAQEDPEFRQELLINAINELLANNLDVAKAMLKDYINSTISFEPLAKKVNKNSKSIQRMLSASGNPTSESLFAVICELQKAEGIKLGVHIRD